MSNYLAIATVTAALERIIMDSLNEDAPGMAQAGLSGSKVTFGRPDQSGESEAMPRVNIFLYQVLTNPALRNDDLPTRRPDGTLVRRPQVALDLYYLLTFYGGEQTWEPQRLLGSVVSGLHHEPLLTSQRIASVKMPAMGDGSQVLANSDLDQQVEAVKFSPMYLNLEEMYKLWSIFPETPYSLSVAYQASVVLIEKQIPTPGAALPVADRTVRAVPFARPLVERVISAGGATAPITVGSDLHILGRGLQGEATMVRIAGVEVAPTQVSDRRITLRMSSLPADQLRAGVQGLQVTHRLLLGVPPTPHRGAESNVAPFVLHPMITQASALDAKMVEVTLNPPVRPGQRVRLLLDELELEPQAGRPARTYGIELQEEVKVAVPAVQFPISGVEPGDYLVRVQVDGAESLLEMDENGRYHEPKVTIS